MGFLDIIGLAHFWANCKATFASAGHTHSVATVADPGLMSAADKLKLDGLSAGGDSGWTLLWSGSWGANGSSPLTIPGLSNCNELMFGLSSRANVVRRKLLSASLSMNVTDDGLSTNNGLYHYAHTLTTEGNTISVDVSRRWIISNSGAVSYALNTTNRIAFIWGRYNAEDA